MLIISGGNSNASTKDKSLNKDSGYLKSVRLFVIVHTKSNGTANIQ